MALESHDEARPGSTKLNMAATVATGMGCHCQVTLTGPQSRQVGTSASSCLDLPSPVEPIGRTNQEATWQRRSVVYRDTEQNTERWAWS